ncbi:ABC transporter ATP-binding protein [Methylobacterium sp. JK268]
MSEIAIRGAVKTYGRTTVVHGLDLTIPSGAFAVILGPSGCGKSSLLRMIAGLETISGGEIAFDGRVVNDLDPRARGCAMVFQNYALYPHMSVAQNIGYALKVAGTPRRERERRVAAVAEALGLTEMLARRPGQLSGGQRQRVAMGRAMIREPKVFLYDEPLSNLDAKLRVQMRAEIRRLHRRLGTTTVFVTHDQAEAMTLADRIVVMQAGRVEQVGTPLEVYRRPASLFVAGFIGSPPMNLLAGQAVDARTVAVGERRIAVPAHALAAGEAVVLGIRPEEVARDGPEVMEVGFVEELGAHRCCHGAFAGQDFVVQRPPGETAPARLSFGIPPHAVHLFHAATGRRVEPLAEAAASVPAMAETPSA